MCELLLINYDKSDPDPEIDKWMYKRGMMVTVQDNGWAWNETELSSAYKILYVPGITKAQALKFIKHKESLTEVDDIGNPLPLTRRRYVLDLDAWTPADDAFLVSGVNAQQQLKRIEDRVIDLQAA
jgi:hypothetical protein